MKGQFGQSVIQVKRQALLERIKANRDNHKVDYDKTWDGYSKAVTKFFEENMAELKAGRKWKNTAFSGPVPQDHTEDYDRVIDMLSMEIREDLEIDEQQFAQYVRDDWGWKNQFVTTSANYR